MILVLDRQWPSMARAMGHPELIEDPRFATMRDRAKNRYELAAIVEAWMQAQPSTEAVLKILEEHRVAAAPVMSVVDTVSHPHFKARNMIRTVPDPILGEVMIPGFPLKFSAFPKPLEIRAPLLGEHGADSPARTTRHERRGNRRTAKLRACCIRRTNSARIRASHDRQLRSFDICLALAKLVES